MMKMNVLLEMMGELVSVELNKLLISKEEDENGATLLVEETVESFEITIERDEISLYEVVTNGVILPVDFSIKKETLLELTRREPLSIFKLAVLFEKFENYPWFDIESLSQKIMVLSDKGCKIEALYKDMERAKPAKLAKLFDESYDLLEAYRRLSY